MAALPLRERHRVGELDLAGIGRERRLDDERPREVAPLRPVGPDRANRPMARIGVEQTREDGVAVVAGQAQPIDRAVAVDECGRVAVRQQAVVRDRL